MAIEERKREAGIVTEVAVAFRAELLVPYIRDIYPNYQPAQVSAPEMEAIVPRPAKTRTLFPEPPPIPGERGRALRKFLALERSAASPSASWRLTTIGAPCAEYSFGCLMRPISSRSWIQPKVQTGPTTGLPYGTVKYNAIYFVLDRYPLGRIV